MLKFSHLSGAIALMLLCSPLSGCHRSGYAFQTLHTRTLPSHPAVVPTGSCTHCNANAEPDHQPQQLTAQMLHTKHAAFPIALNQSAALTAAKVALPKPLTHNNYQHPAAYHRIGRPLAKIFALASQNGTRSVGYFILAVLLTLIGLNFLLIGGLGVLFGNTTYAAYLIVPAVLALGMGFGYLPRLFNP
jgi:hypothetical protein